MISLSNTPRSWSTGVYVLCLGLWLFASCQPPSSPKPDKIVDITPVVTTTTAITTTTTTAVAAAVVPLTLGEMLLDIPTINDLVPSTLLTSSNRASSNSAIARVVVAPTPSGIVATANPTVIGEKFLGMTLSIKTAQDLNLRTLIVHLAGMTDLAIGVNTPVGSLTIGPGSMDGGKVRVERKVAGKIEIYWSGPTMQLGPYMPTTQMFAYIVVEGSAKGTIKHNQVLSLRKWDEATNKVDMTTESGRITLCYDPNGTIRGTTALNQVVNGTPTPTSGFVEVKKQANGKVYFASFDPAGLRTLGYGNNTSSVVRSLENGFRYDEYYENRKFKYFDYTEGPKSGWGTDFITTTQALYYDEAAATADTRPIYSYFGGGTKTELSSYKFNDVFFMTGTKWVHWLPVGGFDTALFTVPDMTADKAELNNLADSLKATIDVSTSAKLTAMAEAICPMPDVSLFP